ncbi:hypothetical protein CKA32_004603 [Geitlerinema sp. FC II]|nr:hypothetical protein CKA32_004603 [Geitlerinema sp. FC II]
MSKSLQSQQRVDRPTRLNAHRTNAPSSRVFAGFPQEG